MKDAEDLRKELAEKQRECEAAAAAGGRFLVGPDAPTTEEMSDLAVRIISEGPAAVAADVGLDRFDRLVRAFAMFLVHACLQRHIEGLRLEIDRLEDPVEPRRVRRPPEPPVT